MHSEHSELFSRAETRRLRDVVLSTGDDRATHRDKLARIVLDEMYQFVGLLDASGMTLEINRAALEGAALRLDDVRGKPFWEARWWAVSAETVQTTRELVGRAAQGEFVRCDVEVFGTAAGEETIVIDFSLMPVRDAQGQVVFLLAEGRNITEKKRAEAQLARKNEELQNLLDKLRQADQLKNDFIANISHELRTPLALILGPAELILADSTNLSERQRRDLTVIHRNASALLGQVNDLLDLATVAAGKLGLHYARIDLGLALRRAAEQFDVLAPPRRIHYVVSMAEPVQAEVDPKKVERVLLNLLSNAFKFTPAGGRIRCALELSGPHACVISVQDSGAGVAPHLRRAIFERFRQASGGTRRDTGGTGLGLAIAKEFVELHRGTIAVSDAPGGGALFQVEIPLQAPAGSYVRATDRGTDAANDHASDRADDRANDRTNDRTSDGDTPAALLERACADGGFAGVGPSHRGRSVGGASSTALDAAEAERAGLPSAAPRDDLPTVVVVEDNADMRHFITQVLADDYRVVAAGDGA